MFRFTSKILGVTILALGLIWFASPGDAVQTSEDGPRELWANVYVDNSGDTVHIKVGDETSGEIPEKRPRDNFLRGVKQLTRSAHEIRNRYMEEVDMDQIIRAGIEGMLDELDRYSVFMGEEAYASLMESTRGNYEGVGLQIDSREDYIRIIAPIEGTPAYRKGLRAGDIIWEIEGESTFEISSSDAASKMRGEAGTSVNLTIKREGTAELLHFEVERAVITLKSVNYYGVLPDTDIGYVRLSRFAEETSNELREAITDLNEQGIGSLIFDLRSNGGGLLDQAKETAELFLEQGSDIVYTRGRYLDSERRYKSERPPIYPLDKPLVILVDEGTASASEIVAGAVQDWDRGLIVGSTTWGKGLVQQVRLLADDGSTAIKLTTAKYYVPSGRCIQKPERQAKDNDHARAETEDETDSLTVTEREIFYTNAGRIVYGGGGIVPDVEIDREIWEPIEMNLERQSMFFDFAIKYVAEHPDVHPEFEVGDELLEEFRNFVASKDFSYKTSVQVALEELEAEINEDDKVEIFEETIADMMTLIEQSKASDYEKSRDYIERAIRREVVRAIAGERGVYEQIILKNNKAIQKAVELLGSPQEYTRMMTEGQTASKL